MFGFGKRDKKSSSDQGAVVSPAPATAPPATEGDMFGGMQARTRRKQKHAEQPDTTTEASPQPAAQEEAVAAKASEQKPFFSSFNFATTATGMKNVDMSMYEDDPATARVRRRLERFYSFYNPTKLPNVDETLKRFEGREDELFEALVKKYGPEPSGPATGDADNGGRGDRRGKQTTKHSDEASEITTDPPPANPTLTTTTTHNTKNPQEDRGTSDFGGGGFGTSSEGFTTNADTGFFGAASDFSRVAPEFDGATFDAAGTTESGFGFAFNASNTLGMEPRLDDHDAKIDQATTFGFIETDPSSAAAAWSEPSAFGFLGAPATDEAPDTDFPAAGATTVEPRATLPHHDSSTEEDSDDETGRYAKIERVDHCIEAARASLSESRLAAARALQDKATKRRLRRSLVAEYSRLEGDLERLTATEDYEAADAVNSRLDEISHRIEALDTLHDDDLSSVVHDGVNTALQRLAVEYLEQRTILHDSRAEEERQTMNYIAEARTRLEQVVETVKGDLEKATRLLKNTQQEVDNLAERRKKIEDKIADQTKELRAERAKVASQATKLEEEIKELERTLALKRRSLSERRVALQDMDHQLALIRDAHQESTSSITAQEAEETARLTEARQRVEALTASQATNDRAAEELQQETASMMKSLEERARKIKVFEQNAKIISSEMLSEFDAFFNEAIGRVLSARAEGQIYLAISPHNASSAEAGQIAALTAKLLSVETEIKAILDDENRAVARAKELAALLPTLEASKKAAASAKQFKEAASKTEEIRRANEEREKVLAEAEHCRTKAMALEATAREIRTEKEVEAVRFRKHIRKFTDRYAMELRRALAAVEMATGAKTGDLKFLDSQPLFEESMDNPDADCDTGSVDVLRSATSDYIMSLFEELAGILDVPVNTLLSEPSDDALAESNSSAPLNGTHDEFKPGAVESDAKIDDHNHSDSPAHFDELDMHQLHALLAEKSVALDAAVTAEDYVECERLQGDITALETAIAERT